MSNNNTLSSVITSIQNELKVDSNGVGYCSIRGAARLVGVDERALRRHFQSADFSSSKLAEMLTSKGFNPADFSENGVQDVALAIIIKYYGYKAGARCTKQAELAADAYEAIGIRAWMQSLLGWQAQPRYAPDTPHIARIKERARHIIANHLWAPFFECYLVFEHLEQTLGFVFTYLCLIDGSVGKHWVLSRANKPWALPAETYIHNFDDQRGPRVCAAYRYEELPYFKDWLEQVYIPVHMPKYLVEKFGKLAVKEVYTQHNIMTDYVAKLVSGKVTPKQQRLYQEWQEKKRFALRANASSGNCLQSISA